MSRLFAGIPIPKDIAAQIRMSLELKKWNLPKARWLEDSDLHITLCFLGETSAEDCDELRERLRKASLSESFHYSIDTFGTFPHWQSAKILWAGSSKPPPTKLLNLSQNIRKIVGDLGLFFDDKALLPHVTLARFQKPWKAASFDRESSTSAHVVTVDRYCLYESMGESSYKILESYSLSDPTR
mgnify:CR=1 FL=1